MINYSDNEKSTRLVIGYGNTLRGDDGAGQKVAQSVADWKLKNVISLAVHQLTPELSETMAKADIVIFVDTVAVTNRETKKLQIKKLNVNGKTNILGHYSNPEDLLFLTQLLYQKSPTAYWLLIPGIYFAFGETLSEVTERFIYLALAEIQEIISSV